MGKILRKVELNCQCGWSKTYRLPDHSWILAKVNTWIIVRHLRENHRETLIEIEKQLETGEKDIEDVVDAEFVPDE